MLDLSKVPDVSADRQIAVRISENHLGALSAHESSDGGMVHGIAGDFRVVW
jgi:hypothetical protein